MKAKLIDGKTISAELRAQMKKEVAALAEDGITPGLAVVIGGDDPASKVDVRNKKKACEELGIYSEAVSYTHLDVYKRQRCGRWEFQATARLSCSIGTHTPMARV